MKKRKTTSKSLTNKQAPSLDRAEAAVQTLIELVGEDAKREGLVKTPKRVVKSFLELTAGYKENPKEILSTTFQQAYNEMVVVKDIEFWSLCEHHLLPFYGTATVGYIPKKRIVGLSKISRLVHCFARRFQVQERMTEEIAHSMEKYLDPQGVGVIIKARHTCMNMRGAKASGVMMTSCLLGQFRDSATRSEFLSLRGKSVESNSLSTV